MAFVTASMCARVKLETVVGQRMQIGPRRTTDRARLLLRQLGHRAPSVDDRHIVVNDARLAVLGLREELGVGLGALEGDRAARSGR